MKKKQKKIVRKSYAKIAKQDKTSCCDQISSCCGTSNLAVDISKKIGYSDEEIKAVPEGANLGLGCGNPVAIASLKEGETVMDLGSGAGFDVFLASKKVGKTGKVIGVDMTTEMVEKARENAMKGNYKNVEFRLGEIEKLPAKNNSIDVIISNCVINLSPDKKAVYREVFRVLKPGGRIMISDIVLLNKLPDFIKNSIDAYVGCVSGAILKDKYLKIIKNSGFDDVEIIDEVKVSLDLWLNDSTYKQAMKDIDITHEKAKEILGNIASIKLKGVKPILS
jgi:ubiquinone/menaquinone biosynthesis C-methylase UbiE